MIYVSWCNNYKILEEEIGIHERIPNIEEKNIKMIYADSYELRLISQLIQYRTHLFGRCAWKGCDAREVWELIKNYKTS